MVDEPSKPSAARRRAVWSVVLVVVAVAAALGATMLSQQRASASSPSAPATPSGHVVAMASPATNTATAGPALTQSSQASTTSTEPGGDASPADGPARAFAPAQLPHSVGETWSAGTLEPQKVLAGHSVELNECVTIAHALTWQQRAYTGSAGDAAIEETYTFTSAGNASSAYAAIVASMNECQATSRALQSANGIDPADAIVTRTAVEPQAAAFERSWTGVEGVSAAGPQANHLYAAVRGSVLVVLHFDEFSLHPAYDVGADAGVLHTLSTVLAP